MTLLTLVLVSSLHRVHLQAYFGHSGHTHPGGFSGQNLHSSSGVSSGTRGHKQLHIVHNAQRHFKLSLPLGFASGVIGHRVELHLRLS